MGWCIVDIMVWKAWVADIKEKKGKGLRKWHEQRS